MLKSNLLTIDILRHGIKDENSLALIESTCIDLLGIEELTNVVRGSQSKLGRLSLDELDKIHNRKTKDVKEQHAGLAFLLNSTYQSGMTPLTLFECTRGIWRNPPTEKKFKFAYATYEGIVKEVYEIKGWLPAGTQAYFTRDFTNRDCSDRLEFYGSIANEFVRKEYVGHLIEKDRSFGSPFMKVGIKSP